MCRDFAGKRYIGVFNKFIGYFSDVIAVNTSITYTMHRVL